MKKATPLTHFKSESSNNNSENFKTSTEIDFNEWGHVESIPIFIHKCEILNANLLKAISKIDYIFTHKHSTMDDVEYLKNLELDFHIFSFVPLGRKINKKELDSYDNLGSGLFFILLKISLKLSLIFAFKLLFKKKNNNVYYYPDKEVELNDEKRLLFKNLITKYLNESIVSYCNFFDNKNTYKWDDKKNEFKSIIILNVEGYKFLNDFFENLNLFFTHLPFHIIDRYTPKSIGFGFQERKKLAENEPDLLKKKEIYAEGMAQLEMSILGTNGRYYAFNMHEYPEEIKMFRKAIDVLEEQIKHSTPSVISETPLKEIKVNPTYLKLDDYLSLYQSNIDSDICNNKGMTTFTTDSLIQEIKDVMSELKPIRLDSDRTRKVIESYFKKHSRKKNGLNDDIIYVRDTTDYLLLRNWLYNICSRNESYYHAYVVLTQYCNDHEENDVRKFLEIEFKTPMEVEAALMRDINEERNVKCNSTPEKDRKQNQNERTIKSTLDDFLIDKTNCKLMQDIQIAFNDLEGKRLAILISLLRNEYKIINIISNSKTHSRKHFIQLFKDDASFNKMEAVNKYIDQFSQELNLNTALEFDADYMDVKHKLTKIIDNSVV